MSSKKGGQEKGKLVAKEKVEGRRVDKKWYNSCQKSEILQAMYLASVKVIYPKYWKHLKEAAQHSQFGRWKVGLFCGSLACTLSKT